MTGEGKTTMQWRCQDDPDDRLGLAMDESSNIEVYAGGMYTTHTPAQARAIAAELLRLADEAEAGA